MARSRLFVPLGCRIAILGIGERKNLPDTRGAPASVEGVYTENLRETSQIRGVDLAQTL